MIATARPQVRPAAAAVVFFAFTLLGPMLPGPAALAAEVAPPMLDINRQCDAQNRHNATAMSECVVAESEARAELLQNWSKYPDGDAEKCIKLGRKAKRLPYSAIAKCLTAEAATLPPAHKAN